MLSSVNPDDFSVGRESEMDAQLLVRFFMKPKQDKKATEEAGRPIYKDVEHCEIRVRGNRDPQACRPATLRDKERFPRHYEAFKKRVELPEEGTPLAEWPQISRSQVEELSFVNVKTVEQLVDVADTHISKIHGGYSLKQKAATWLESANDNAKLAKINREQAQQIADLTEKVDQLLRAHITSADNEAGVEVLSPNNTTLVGSALDAEINDELDEPAKPVEATKRKSRRKPKPE